MEKLWGCCCESKCTCTHRSELHFIYVYTHSHIHTSTHAHIRNYTNVLVKLTSSQRQRQRRRRRIAVETVPGRVSLAVYMHACTYYVCVCATRTKVCQGFLNNMLCSVNVYEQKQRHRRQREQQHRFHLPPPTDIIFQAFDLLLL